MFFKTPNVGFYRLLIFQRTLRVEKTRAENRGQKCAEELETLFLKVLCVGDHTGSYCGQFVSESTTVANGMRFCFGRSNYNR